MKTLRVEFTSGRDVLGHYWGFLSGGGLAIGTPTGGTPAYIPGELVRLEVHVCSIKKTYHLDAQVLDVRTGDETKTQVMVSFMAHTPPDELLDAAWADGCDAPQRRSRRVPARVQVRYDCLDGSRVEGRVGHLVNLSTGGCCVEGSALPPPGTQVILTTVQGSEEGVPLKLVGKVRWTERPEGGLMGIEFLRPDPEVGLLMQALVR